METPLKKHVSLKYSLVYFNELETGCTSDRPGERGRIRLRGNIVQCVVFHEGMASLTHPGPQRGGARIQHCSGGQGRDKLQK